MEKIGKSIKAARKAAGLTQKELAQKLGISFQSVAQWENDLRRPKFETIQKIADALGTCRGAVRNVIDKDELLKQALVEARERWIDDIEDSVLSRAHESNDTALQCFVLKTQARHRGWDQDEVKNSAKDIATAAFDFILNKSKNPAE